MQCRRRRPVHKTLPHARSSRRTGSRHFPPSSPREPASGPETVWTGKQTNLPAFEFKWSYNEKENNHRVIKTHTYINPKGK